MKKTVVLVTLLVLLAAAVAAVFLLPPWLASRTWERAATRLTERLGRDVSAADVEFSVFSPLVVRDLTIAGTTPGDAPLLAIERIEVDLDAWSLVFGPPEVRLITVDRPVVTVSLAAGGAPELGDLPERLRTLLGSDEDPAPDGDAGADAAGGDGGLVSRVLRAAPELQVTRGEARLVGAGASAYAALTPGGAVPEGGFVVEHGEIVVRNKSMLAEEPLYEVDGNAAIPALDRHIHLLATLNWNERTIEASLDGGGRPFTWSLGERTLSVGGVSFGSDSGLRVKDVTLTQPSAKDGSEPERPFLRIREILIGLGAPAPPAPPAAEGAAEGEGASGDPPPTGAFAAVAARIDRVDFYEPEIYFSRDPEARTPIADLEETLYVDELDARIDEDLAIDDEATTEEPPEPAPAEGKRRRLKPNGERARAWVGHQFERLQASFADFTGFVHRAGTRLPVREVHVRRGRFLYEDAAESGSVSHKLYNFFLDAERRMPDQVFAFKMHFETPDAARSKNRIEGSIDLTSRDLQVQLRVDRLALERYRPLLPASFRVSPDSLLHDTDLTLSYNSAKDELRAHGRIFLRDFELFHPGIAEDPLEDMAAGAEFAITVEFGQHRLTLSPSTIYLNDVKFTVEGTIEDYAVAPRIHFGFELPRTNAMDIVGSVPRGLVPRLAGVKMTGSLALTATLDLDTADLNTLKYDIVPQPRNLAVTDMGDQADLSRLERTFRHTVHERDGTVSSFRVGPGAPGWVPLGDVSRYMMLALTTTEDGRFFRHDGFSPTQIRRSIIANLERGYFYRGASTISQQLVKNLYLTRDKTISRKLQEVFITWQMEQRIPKERILELYLNVIEWGPNLYGIKAAAEHYFGKKPRELSLLDTAFLVSIIPNPRRFYDQYERGEVTPRWRARLRRIVEAMAERGKVSAAEAARCAPYSPYFDGRRPARDDDANNRAPAPPPSTPTIVRDQDIPLPPGH